ncbi:LysE/ArgO family amino acid transporter [Bacillus sp. JJ1609]|uniref:LysE/ArgO family amino acid transporter n=1 Tax=Bacillus sp. JJ1609 TaxID=3122977 RepID=UPI002FFE7136
MFSASIHGLILAFGLILPLGVQNVFVFNQGAIQPSYKKALPVILTASICDSILITLAVLGVSVIIIKISWLNTILLSAGILFLIYMGYVTWKSKPHSNTIEKGSFTPKKQIAFAASVSILNPHAIMDTIGVIGTSSIAYSSADKIAFTLACIFTSWIWFLSLAYVGRQAGRLGNSAGFLAVLNKVSALIMWGTAMYLAIQLLNK